jgi:hypothetical protein
MTREMFVLLVTMKSKEDTSIGSSYNDESSFQVNHLLIHRQPLSFPSFLALLEGTRRVAECVQRLAKEAGLESRLSLENFGLASLQQAMSLSMSIV